MPLLLANNIQQPPWPLCPVKAPGSKSVCNRALLLAALCDGDSRLKGVLEADDTRAMRDCLRALGTRIQEEPDTWIVSGGGSPCSRKPLPVKASGTTLRFLLPWLALTAGEPVQFEGDPRLFERPLGGLLKALQHLGAAWAPRPGGGTLHPAPARPSSIDLEIDASSSSQFLTGLALTAASLPEGGRLRWRGNPPSASYLELTVRWMEAFGCETRLTREGWVIPGGALRARELVIPGDWSGAAAYLCAAAVTGRRVQVSPLDPADPQGDRAITAILEAAGCQVRWLGPDLLGLEGSLVRGLEWDLTLCPDLGPVLAATAALAPAPSVLTGLQTLPLKECDRLQASAELVRWLGGRAEIVGDHTLRIHPGSCPGDRAPFDPRNDHRMAFAAAVGALRCGGELLNPGCVSKTIPTFWEDWNAMLGIRR